MLSIGPGEYIGALGVYRRPGVAPGGPGELP